MAAVPWPVAVLCFPEGLLGSFVAGVAFFLVFEAVVDEGSWAVLWALATTGDSVPHNAITTIPIEPNLFIR